MFFELENELLYVTFSYILENAATDEVMFVKEAGIFTPFCIMALHIF
jgi:hypothetical protein